ncbi:F-box only protein 27-like [Rhea pennata]|uniref:F-box only protein 27-like n=1 Tax=Rhea pennata TaxID=8795 RepID=UPI002E2620F0
MGQAALREPNRGGGDGGACRPLDLNRAPDEVLVLILSWVPARTLVTRCRLVCRRWRAVADDPAVWRLRLERAGRSACLRAARLSPPPAAAAWARLCVLRPLDRNLLRNPCGTENFAHWWVQNGGDGWAIEENRRPLPGAPAQTCFVSSFDWCSKSQLVDLLAEGLWEELLDAWQPEIHVSDWWGSREDCGCEYSLRVRLLAADRRSVLATFEARPEPVQQWNDQRYQQVSHVFRRYGPGVRYVHFRHRGKDTQFWAGRYGARVAHSAVVVRLGPRRDRDRDRDRDPDREAAAAPLPPAAGPGAARRPPRTPAPPLAGAVGP